VIGLRSIALFLAVTGGAGHATEPLFTAEQAVAQYQTLTAADANCKRRANPDEIIVCGRRDADRYRIPLIEHGAGDPHVQDVYAERERLQYKTTPCQNRSIFLIGCGMVGVGFTTRLDGGGPRYRALAK
jgi:hypothetical protein